MSGLFIALLIACVWLPLVAIAVWVNQTRARRRS